VDWNRDAGHRDHDRNTLRLRLDPEGEPAGLEPGMTEWIENSEDGVTIMELALDRSYPAKRRDNAGPTSDWRGGSAPARLHVTAAQADANDNA
jgi:hypothetical protein